MRTRATSWSWNTRRRMRPLAAGLLVASVLGAAGSFVVNAAGASSSVEVVVKIVPTTTYGRILATTKGLTLYTYAHDTKNRSNCTAKCATTWPPLILRKGMVAVGRGVSGLGAILRSNGQRQVTFHGMPLYRFVGDTRSGQINGENVGSFHVAQLVVKRTTTTTTTTKSYGY